MADPTGQDRIDALAVDTADAAFEDGIRHAISFLLVRGDIDDDPDELAEEIGDAAFRDPTRFGEATMSRLGIDRPRLVAIDEMAWP